MGWSVGIYLTMLEIDFFYFPALRGRSNLP